MGFSMKISLSVSSSCSVGLRSSSIIEISVYVTATGVLSMCSCDLNALLSAVMIPSFGIGINLFTHAFVVVSQGCERFMQVGQLLIKIFGI